MGNSYNPFLMFLLATLGILFYFLPFIIGYNKRNATSIFFLNLLLGWTFIGWVVALIWATSKDSKPVVASGPVTMTDELIKLARLREQGHLTEDEYQKQKSRLLK